MKKEILDLKSCLNNSTTKEYENYLLRAKSQSDMTFTAFAQAHVK